LPVLFLRRKAGRGWFSSIVEEIVQKAREALTSESRNCILSAVSIPSLPVSYYTDMLKRLRALVRKFS